MTNPQSTTTLRRQSRKLPHVASTRLNDEDWADLRALADREGRSPADQLRQLIRRATA